MTSKVLLISPDSAIGGTVDEGFADARDDSFTVERSTCLSDGIERLGTNVFAAVLLDLNLPDSQGIASLEQVWRAARNIPIVIIGSPDEQGLASQAVWRGDRSSMLRAIRGVVKSNAAEEASLVEHQRAEVMLNSIGDAVLSIDIVGNVTYLNPVAESMTGWSRADALGRPLEEVFQLIECDARELARNPPRTAAQIEDTVGLISNCTLVRRDGLETEIEDFASPMRDPGGNVIGTVRVFHDVSAARALSLRATHLAQHDFLTALPNRALLNDRLTQAMALAHRHNHRLAVLFLDLDGFKQVNDNMGHMIGDTLLQSVAGRLATCVRSSDTVSRQGGDEFVVLLSQIDNWDDAVAGAQKIHAALVTPCEVGQQHVRVTASIGISIYPDHALKAEALITCADTAMYDAKARGRNTYRFFKEDMQARAVERQWIEAGLRRALAEREFVLHYQPKVNLVTGTVTGAEALIRWVHPTRGIILPKDFVPIAEECGLIVPIGQWVVHEACRQARIWIDEGRPTVVAVNVSAVEFRDLRFLDNLRTVLHDNSLDPRYLEIELTEGSLMQHVESSALALHALKNAGVRATLDDFGRGYSSLSYLRQFPINAMKVHHSFVHEISADPVDTSILCAMITMGRSLGHRVIAEGVETREQLAFLQAQRCGEGQGNYFSRPLAADQFGRLLEADVPLVLQ